MIKVLSHGSFHYKTECKKCLCEFEYDKKDIGEYIEDGEKIFKIRCPECGNAIKIEEGGLG